MCSVSAIGDYANNYYKDWIQAPVFWSAPNQTTAAPTIPQNPFKVVPPKEVSREEFDKLKAEFEELKTLLIAAKRYDEKTDQHHCEVEEKVAILKKLAEYFEVDLKDVFE